MSQNKRVVLKGYAVVCNLLYVIYSLFVLFNVSTDLVKRCMFVQMVITNITIVP